MKRLWEILFGKKPEPVFEDVSLGWVARVHYSRPSGSAYVRETVFCSTMQPDKTSAKAKMHAWSRLVRDLSAGTRNVLPLERVTADGATFYLALTQDDALRGIRVDVHEVVVTREVK